MSAAARSTGITVPAIIPGGILVVVVFVSTLSVFVAVVLVCRSVVGSMVLMSSASVFVEDKLSVDWTSSPEKKVGGGGGGEAHIFP